MNQYYVYIYKDPNSLEPFYVGKGVRNRKLKHLSETKDTTENPRKFNKIQKLLREGTPPIIEEVKSGLSEEEAYDLESQLIKQYGRKDYDAEGILLNICTDARPPNMTGRKFSKSHWENHHKAILKYHESYEQHWNKGRERPDISEGLKRSYQNGRKPFNGKDTSGSNNYNAKWYKLTAPDGTIYEIKCLKEFCKEKGLSTATMTANLRYKKQMKGWKVEALN